MKNQNNYVAIMAGGVGSRFWPMSKTSYPKQFLDILNTGKTLIQSTYDRYTSFIPEENIFVVTSEEYVSIVREQLPMLPAENIVAEPQRKNTAACVAYISFKLQKINPNANMIVAPSDHLIGDLDLFTQTCQKALDYTSSSYSFVTLGIKPTHPNTGYGYIQYDENKSSEGIFQVNRFTEKPDLSTAREFLSEGNYLWNSGIFIWKAEDIIDSFWEHSQYIYDLFKDIEADLNTEKEAEAIRKVYEVCPSTSIDYAIMEKANNVFLIPSDFSWNDLGTWNSAWENFSKDEEMNASNSNSTILVDSKGCLVHSNEQKLMVIGGLEDLIIVNTPEALLICKKENEQQIKEYVAKVRKVKGELYI
ncbi:mannose-1-phosphate guanylyltransferase [Algoriphagus winogradskyi]|uniref:Mannose-1-phosphate guanylyltransferase n=1 Tax=Algoriphagus winogradskyi TaxID=237017 RepID=A0ABY1NFD9_9BACT|nr:mannose-1-phosphate guanylyltransferase [Algoriphagus winogradskyi]SMP08279.1 mannose-1-phosphate guanylyltransferase [Algoriphagus winogradskyi]